MAFFATLFALLLQQTAPLLLARPLARAGRRWLRLVGRNVDAGTSWSAWLAWALAALLPALAVWALGWLLHWLGGWPLRLLWHTLVLYACLGFWRCGQQFSHMRDALEAGEHTRARQLLARWRQPDARSVPPADLPRQAIARAVLAAHQQVFGVLAAYVLGLLLGLGPAGAVLYRQAASARAHWQRQASAASQPSSPTLRAAAHAAWAVLDWLPARLTALLMAMAGQFAEALSLWRQRAVRPAAGGDGVVLAAAAGALGLRLWPAASAAVPGWPGQNPHNAHFQQAADMVWRALALWLLLLALGSALPG